jgi:DNA-binding transcriptional LysR family regulator
MADVLDTLQLRTLVAIAECGGFARAAAALHMSQPTVSQHVRLLEKRLGRSLVEKVGRQARFTAAGERLLLEARRILSVHDEALARLELDGEDSIIIGSTETAANQLLPELLASVREAYPDRRVQFYIDRSTQMRDEVARGAIDLALILDVDADLPGVHIGTLPLNCGHWSPTSLPAACASVPCISSAASAGPSK